MILLYLLLPGILLLGLATSYTDLKYGKIRNRHLLIAMIYGLAVHVIYFYTKYINASLSMPELIETGTNFMIAVIVAYMLYHTAIWTAGDAKLFMIYALLVPIQIYERGHVPFFPAIAVLINTFVPFFVFYFIRLIVFAQKKRKLGALKNSLNPKRILALALSIFALMWPIRILSGLLGAYNPLLAQLFSNFFIVVLVLFLLMSILEKMLLLNFIKMTIVTAVLRLLLDRSIYTMVFLRQFIIIIISFVIVRFFILQLTHSIYVKHVDIHLLRKGMVPAERVFKRKDTYRKAPLLFFSLFSYMKQPSEDDIFDIRPEGLSDKDCRRLRKLKRENKITFDHLKVHQVLPFAVFLFIGVMVTIIAKGNIFALF